MTQVHRIRTSVSISYTHTLTKATQPEPLKPGSFKVLDNQLEYPGASNAHRDAWTAGAAEARENMENGDP